MNDIKLSLKERKEIIKILYLNFLKAYPRYKGSYRKYMAPNLKFPSSLSKVSLSNKEVAQLPLSELEKGVLFATAMGDSSLNISKGFKSPRLQARHSSRQAEWFFWKYLVALGRFNRGLRSVSFSEPDGFQANSKPIPGEKLGKLKITTKATPLLSEPLTILEKGNKKFSRFWLNHMNNYFLMTLYLDDGSLNHSQAQFALDFLPKENLEIFANYLEVVWEVKAIVREAGYKISSQNNRVAYRVFMANQEESLKLFRIIAPIIPVKSMLYKVFLVPTNNVDLLQRWAAELEGLVLEEFKEEVKNFYSKYL